MMRFTLPIALLLTTLTGCVLSGGNESQAQTRPRLTADLALASDRIPFAREWPLECPDGKPPRLPCRNRLPDSLPRR
jgi:hypothetical protein